MASSSQVEVPVFRIVLNYQSVGEVPDLSERVKIP